MKNLKDNTNVAKSNNRFTFSTIIWIVLAVTLLIVDNFFYKIPRIGGLWQNITVMIIVFTVILISLFRNKSTYKKKEDK